MAAAGDGSSGWRESRRVVEAGMGTLVGMTVERDGKENGRMEGWVADGSSKMKEDSADGRGIACAEGMVAGGWRCSARVNAQRFTNFNLRSVDALDVLVVADLQSLLFCSYSCGPAYLWSSPSWLNQTWFMSIVCCAACFSESPLVSKTCCGMNCSADSSQQQAVVTRMQHS